MLLTKFEVTSLRSSHSPFSLGSTDRIVASIGDDLTRPTSFSVTSKQPSAQQPEKSTSPTSSVTRNSLSERCASTIWRSALFVNCSMSGGLANLRNMLQTCIMNAVDLGAGALIPEIIHVRQNNLSSLPIWDTPVDPGFVFDLSYLHKVVIEQCPGLKIEGHSRYENREVMFLDLTGPFEEKIGEGTLAQKLTGELNRQNITTLDEVGIPVVAKTNFLFARDFRADTAQAQLRVLFEVSFREALET